ncbi:MAG: LpxD N-terminal domain-containing protein, partial [Candidatus Acidiferrales bacterium]
MKLGDIAEKLGCRLEGDRDVEITGVAGIEEAQPGQLTFLDNRKYYPLVKTTQASAILIAPDGPAVTIAVLRTAN